MARIGPTNIPPNLVDTVGPLIVYQPGTRQRARSAHLNPSALKPEAQPVYRPSPFGFAHLAAQLCANWPTTYGKAPTSAAYKRILAGIAARDFPGEFWRLVTPYDDRIEVAYPTWVQHAERAIDPLDPDEIKPTWNSYRETVAAWPFAEAGQPGGPPLPGWETALEAGNWIRDAYLALRVLHVEMPTYRTTPLHLPWIGHITGSITAGSSLRGVVSWFAPAVHARFGQDADFGFPSPRAEPGTDAELIPRDLDLPPEQESWMATVDVDLVVRLDVLAYNAWNRRSRFGRITLGTLPTFGRYTGGNTWAWCESNLDLAIYYPTRLR